MALQRLAVERLTEHTSKKRESRNRCLVMLVFMVLTCILRMA